MESKVVVIYFKIALIVNRTHNYKLHSEICSIPKEFAPKQSENDKHNVIGIQCNLV